MSTTDTPWRDENTLRKYHHKKGLCMAEMGRRLGCNPQTISEWLKRHDIEVRQNSHAPAGKDHHNAKPDIPERDYNGKWGEVCYRFRINNEMYCRRCGEDSLNPSNYHLHHDNESDGRETNAGDVDLDDLTPLCPSCHATVEVNGFEVTKDS